MSSEAPSATAACNDTMIRVLEKLDTIGYVMDLGIARPIFKQIHTDVDMLFTMGCLPQKEMQIINYALPLRYDAENTGAIITFRSNTAFAKDIQQLATRKMHIENTLYKYLPRKYQIIRDFAKFIQT